MKKNHSKKIGIVVILIVLMTLFIGQYIYNKEKISNDISENDNKNINLKLGNYTVNEIKIDPAGVPNEECGVKLKENNEFEIYMGWGAWHSGKYEINDNKLICKSTLLEWDGGAGPGNKTTDVIFTFEIINENKLQLVDIKINDTINSNLIYEEGLEKGMTYSIKY